MNHFLYSMPTSQDLIRNFPADGRLTDELERALAHEEMLNNSSLVNPLADLFAVAKQAFLRVIGRTKSHGLQQAGA
ncbi:hypothetical protein FXN63_17035 [Pigmentiphaga aceris]|uniref:Uncharacterized protein n=1 Tax=Pigmentiphaga aceris TaxID=1940612 RepID=A0A5C0B488_9BURK|nr:hypothetical protein [Pigmentiphaga aceris]QEI07357.1 hypothetical protein FXN63_17035 [Pigmentiphaga aceris]